MLWTVLSMNPANREYGSIHGDIHSAMELYAKECSWLMIEFNKKCRVKKVEICVDKLPNLRYTSFGHEGADVVAQLIIPFNKGQPLEVLNIISLAAEGNTSRYLYLSNNALPAFNVEEHCLLKQEQLCAQLLNLLKKPGVGCRHTKLCIRSTSFSREAAALVGAMLSSIKHELAGVELSGLVVSGRDGDEALGVVRIFSSALLKSQINLEELYLLNLGISEESAKALRDLFPSTYKLRVLHFHDNHLYITGAVYISEIVRECPLLQDFRCSNSRVHTEGGYFLSSSTDKMSPHKEARFGTQFIYGHLELNDKATGFLAYYLKVSAPSLQVLDMAGNCIGDESARDLASCLASKQSLTKLKLAGNFLGDKGAILIAKALDEGIHDQLCEVDLSRNFIGLDGGVALVRAVSKKPLLKVLNITRNKIYPKDWKSKEVLF
ncbi:hypothetical protein OROMI_006266 [Orobanche minor]